MARKSIMALEGIEEGEVIETPTVGTDLEIEGGSEELSSLDETTDKIEEHSDEVEKATDTAETLTAISGQMKESVKDGGMDEHAAAAIEVAVEHMCRQLGIRKKRTGFVLEGFKDKTSRVQATKLAMEGIKEIADTVWKAIVAAIKKAIEFIKEFADKFFDATISLTKRADAIYNTSEKMLDYSADNKTVNFSSASFILRKDNEAIDSNLFIKNYNLYCSAEPIGTTEEVKIEKLAGNLYVAIKSFRSAEDVYDEKQDQLKNLLKELLPKNPSNTKKIDDYTTSYEEKLPFGDKSLYSVYCNDNNAEMKNKIGAAIINKINGNKVYVDDTEGYTELSVKDVIALEPKEVKSIAFLSKKRLGLYSNYKPSVDKLNQKLKGLQGLSDAFMNDSSEKRNESNKEDLEKRGSVYNEAAAYVRFAVRMATNTLSQLRKYDIDVIKGALDYCAASLKVATK